MPRLRHWQPSDWPSFLSVDLETAQDALGEATEQERAALRENRPRLLAEQNRFTPGSFAAPNADLWVLESDDGSYLGHLWLTEMRDSLIGTRLLEVTSMG